MGHFFQLTLPESTNTFFFNDLTAFQGTWKQVSGINPDLAKNQLSFTTGNNGGLKGSFRIVEPKKTILYDIEIIESPEGLILKALRDKQMTEWKGEIKGGALVFTRLFDESGDKYYMRQTLLIDKEGALIRRMEKSYDGNNYQGIEEKYVSIN